MIFRRILGGTLDSIGSITGTIAATIAQLPAALGAGEHTVQIRWGHHGVYWPDSACH